MAREPRSRGEEAAPAAEAGGTRGRLPERTTKVPAGPSFAMTVGFASGVAAAVVAFVGALGGAMMSPADPGEALDTGGLQAARLLAAGGSDRWRPGFGSTTAIRQKARDFLEAKANETKDSRDKTARTTAIDEWRAGKGASGADWRPGFDMIFPPNDPNDTLAEEQRKRSLSDVLAGAKDVEGVAVLDAGGNLVLGVGRVWSTSGPVSKQVGDTRIRRVSETVRQYEHPMKNRNGASDGTAVVALSAASVRPPSPMTTAGLAALGALIGGFAVGFVIAMAPLKAIRRLAQDADAIAGGRWDTRVSIGGPDVVQHAARSLQRIVQNASSLASSVPSEPQVIQQQVMVQPVAEVQEGLAPVKGFRRPDEFEIEATQKPCPDLGNDYYDIVNVDDDNVGIFVADIPNMRGVRGAMYMAQVRALFRSVATGQQSPAETLKALNRAFAADLPRGIYVTAMYAIVSRSTGVCKVAAAQHLPLVFWKLAKKASARLAPEGIALGLDPGPVFDKTIGDKAIQLERGDRIVLYTDGAINARNAAGAQYGEERFYYVLNREAPKNSAACVNFVANDVDLFHEGAAQMDDFTIVTLRKTR